MTPPLVRARALVAALLLAGPAGAAEHEPRCDMSHDGDDDCPRVITPAVIASSSIQPYGRLAISASSRSASVVPFPTLEGATLQEYGLTASPQIGLRAAPFLLIYVGGDGVATSGGNPASVVGQGVSFTGDIVLGAVVQYAGANWRIGLNGRILHGTGLAVDIDRVALGVNSNFIDAQLVQAAEQLGSGVGDAVQKYSITSGRLDLVGAYRSQVFTIQGAIGGESIRQDFDQPVTVFDLQRVVTTAAPRVGAAIGFDPNPWLHRVHAWSPVQFLAEYQVTVNRSWLELVGAPPTSSPPRIADTVLALGIYTSGKLGYNVQIGLTVFHETGLPLELITASQEAVSAVHPSATGGVLSLHYLF